MEYGTVNVSLPYDFLSDIFIFLACFIVRIYYVIYICIKHTKYVNQLFLLLVRLPVKNRLLIVTLWGSQSCTWIATAQG